MNYQKHTPAEVIEALRNAAGYVTVAAQKLNCDWTTVWRYMKRYPEVQRAYENIQEEYLDLSESKLIEAIKNGEAWAICFYLKCKGKKRGYIERAREDEETPKQKTIYQAEVSEYGHIETTEIIPRSKNGNNGKRKIRSNRSGDEDGENNRDGDLVS